METRFDPFGLVLEYVCNRTAGRGQVQFPEQYLIPVPKKKHCSSAFVHETPRGTLPTHTVRYAVYLTHFSDMFQSLENPRLKRCSVQLGFPREDGDSSAMRMVGGNAEAAITTFSVASATSLDSNLISM